MQGHAFFSAHLTIFSYFFGLSSSVIMPTPNIPPAVIKKGPVTAPKQKILGHTHTNLADFGVFRFQWVQGRRHYLYMRMQQVCPVNGCFRPGHQSSGGFDHRQCQFMACPGLYDHASTAITIKCYKNVTQMLHKCLIMLPSMFVHLTITECKMGIYIKKKTYFLESCQVNRQRAGYLGRFNGRWRVVKIEMLVNVCNVTFLNICQHF